MIQVRDLAKFYGGKRALGPVTFEIADGETVGFLGLNGAGKTTALRILACDLRPSAGSVQIGDVNAVEDPHAVRKQVGFLPETPPLYPDMTVGDYLTFAGRLRAMTPAEVEKRLPEVEDLTHLREVHGDLIRNLSHGFRQRVGVAQAVMHQPKLLILDEPTRGLDPVQVVEMRQMIRNLKKSHTVLISSHILPEISETCDRLLILGDGTIVGSGTESELSANVVESIWITVGVKGDQEAIVKCLKAVKGVTEVVPGAALEPGITAYDVNGTEDLRAAAAKALVGGGFDVVRLDRSQRKLENIFLQLVKGGPGARR